MLNNKFIHLLKALVVETLNFSAPTDKLLSNFFRNNKSLTSNERYIVAETVYSLLRNYYKLTALVDAKQTFDLIGLIWVKLLKLDPLLLNSITCINFAKFDSYQFKQGGLSETELPEWLIDQLLQQYSQDDILSLAKSMQIQAPLDLRVNLLKTDVKQVFNTLEKANLKPQLTQFCPFGIRLQDKTFLAKNPLFLSGSIEVQDESSQLAGLLLNPKRGEMVVDFCAGSGGKTLLFGMLMRNSGRIYSFDVNEKRLGNLAPRLARSGLSNVHPQLIGHENDAKIKRLHNKIDKVFVDAPCSGLGTLRRNPELKFRQTKESLAELNAKQLSILNSASKLVKPGGALIYATCSVLKAENQDIVEAFLAVNPEFKLMPATQVINKPELEREDGYLVLLPHIHHTDGFFAALLARQI